MFVYTGGHGTAARAQRRLPPSRDPEARARLEVVGEQARPVTLAHERNIVVPGELGETLGALIRGSTVAVDGDLGAGATSLVFELAAAVTAVGEWVAVVDLEGRAATSGMVGAEAAAAAGVALERFAVIRGVPLDRWSTVVAALLDGMSLVITDVPRHARIGDTRRLVARARERGAVLVALTRTNPLPAPSSSRSSLPRFPAPSLPRSCSMPAAGDGMA